MGRQIDPLGASPESPVESDMIYGYSDLNVIPAKAGIHLVYFLNPGIHRDDK
jgi:hypothetical protein